MSTTLARPTPTSPTTTSSHCSHLTHCTPSNKLHVSPTAPSHILPHRSCSPNAKMREVYCGGTWHVAIVALRRIDVGEEIVHDYDLVTEDKEDVNLATQCSCGAGDACRGSLVRLVEW